MATMENTPNNDKIRSFFDRSQADYSYVRLRSSVEDIDDEEFNTALEKLALDFDKNLEIWIRYIFAII